MGDRKRALELLQGAAENAVDEGVAGVMVIATDGQETLTFPEIAGDANPHVVSLWMVGAHLKHIEESAQAAGGTADMEQVAQDAISFVEEYESVEGAGI